MKLISMVEQDGKLVPAESIPFDAIRSVVDIETMTMVVWQTDDTLPVEITIEPAIPYCDELQMRLALNITGLRPAVEAYVASADQFVKDWWDKATVFKADNPMLLDAATALNQVDALPALFALAAQQPTAR